MPSEQLFEVEEIDGLVTVRFLVPEFYGFDQIDQIQHALLAVVDGNCQTMLWDLSRVEYASSAFVGMFLVVWKRLMERGRTVAICELHADAMRPMKGWQALSVEEFATRQEAIAKLTLPSSPPPPA